MKCDGDASVLVIYGVWSTPLSSLLPGSLSPRVVIPVRVLSKGQIDLIKIICIR